MKFKKTSIKDCYLIENDLSFDDRGNFIKNFHYEKFLKLKNLHFKEQYFSFSKKNVIRGIHFQIPPYDHYKLVTCVSGSILDVLVDLRQKSISYKKVFSIKLSDQMYNSVLIPNGVGHSFLSLSKSIVLYNTTTSYKAKFDKGILWSSIDYEWPVKKPILSQRDQKFPSIDNFNFKF
tara:strand:- start:5336 stop:5866 length:531 start_codon:yes stop_codon:yes gene_type:complete